MIKIEEKEIRKGIDEAYKKAGSNAYFGNGFQAGVEFALKQVNNLSISGVSESALIEELRLKLIGMECFSSEYYNEAAQKGTATIFEELERWVKIKRDKHSH